MDAIKYLVIAEGYGKGFVVGCYFSKKIAEAMASKIFSLSKQIVTDEEVGILQIIADRGYRSYSVNGAVEYCDKCYYCESNGYFTVSIFELKSFSDFRLDMFIKERENYSNVYDLSNLSEANFKKWKTIIDYNPFLIAN